MNQACRSSCICQSGMCIIKWSENVLDYSHRIFSLLIVRFPKDLLQVIVELRILRIWLKITKKMRMLVIHFKSMGSVPLALTPRKRRGFVSQVIMQCISLLNAKVEQNSIQECHQYLCILIGACLFHVYFRHQLSPNILVTKKVGSRKKPKA